MASPRVTVVVEDVHGSFARLMREAPKEVRAFLSQTVASTTVGVAQRMRATVAVDEGELKAAIDVRLPKRNGLSGRAGVFDNEEEVGVALFNEYEPNAQPFMRPAAEAESGDFEARAKRALQRAAAALSRGV